MKKILLLFAFSIGALYGTNAQNQLKLGLNIGTALNYYFGDANVALGADFSYLFPVNERLSFGPNAGFTLLLVNGSDNYGLLPITASGRYHFTDKFFAGADLGYSLIFIDEVNGGFYYRPKVGYEFNAISLLASYIGITQNGGGFSIVNIGVEFSL